MFGAAQLGSLSGVNIVFIYIAVGRTPRSPGEQLLSGHSTCVYFISLITARGTTHAVVQKHGLESNIKATQSM